MTLRHARSRPSVSRWCGVVCLTLVAVAVAACDVSTDRATQRSAATNPTATPAATTRITTVDPWSRDGGLAKGYTVTGESPGTCMPSVTSSRADAFRCFDADNQVFDPCLAGRYADPVERVACPVAPRKVHVVRVSGGMDRTSGGTPPEQGDFWMATLADGTRCRSSTGAGPPPREGFEVRMYCRDGILWGPFDSATPLWTVRRSATDTGPLSTAGVTEAYR